MKIIIILILMICYGTAFSQSLSVFDVDISNFPTIKAKVFAFDAGGNQITNISASDFEVKENGQIRNVTYLSCPAPKPPQALSSVLVMDASGSMSSGSLTIEKEAAKAWIEGLPLGKSECAITSFNTKNYFVQDYTTNKSKLLNGANSLVSGGGTSYDAAMLDPLAGGLLVTKNAKFKRVIVFLSDGMPNYEPQTAKIIAEANSQNVTVYTVTLNLKAPQNMKDMSTQTGGMCFENVTTVEQARQIYQQILQTAQGGDPCEIEWFSGGFCVAGIKNVEFKLKPINLTAKASYQSPNTLVAKLEFTPKSVKFENPIPGEKVEQKITVTANNANFTVTKITSNNAAFTITPNSFMLNAGQSRELTVSYLPADSGYNYCKFEIENDLCPTKYYASGGWKGKKPTIRTLKLINPNGREELVVGSDTLITWEGVSPDEPVKIEYSTNNGSNWITIADTAIGLRYNWCVPKTPSNQCLARLTAAIIISSSCENPVVVICGKKWMGCNLDVEYYSNWDPIPEVTDPTEWANLTTGAWCYYNNDPSNGEILGKLYNWYAVNDPRGLAPYGWHIATDEEWTELENCLGGSTVAGKKLKSTGTIEGGNGLWRSPNKGATNESGFSAHPGGRRFYNGSFYDIGDYGDWWSATEIDASNAWYRHLFYDYPNLGRGHAWKKIGYSVRCVRD